MLLGLDSIAARGTGFQGRCHKEENRGSLRGRGCRRDGTTPAVNNVLSPSSSLVVKSVAPDHGALMRRGNEMSEISKLDRLQIRPRLSKPKKCEENFLNFAALVRKKYNPWASRARRLS